MVEPLMITIDFIYRELQLDKPEQPMSLFACLPCCRYPLVVTRVKAIRATGLEKQDRDGGNKAFKTPFLAHL